MKLSIIIVNYNVKYLLEQCLHSVMRAIKHINAEIFVVDNDSTDGSRKFFMGKFSAVKFIWNTENTGFAKANNAALELATGKYVLFLNPDTLVPEDCFSKCIACLDATPDAGGLGIQMIDGRGNFLRESKRSFPAPMASFFKLSGLSALFPRSKQISRYNLGHMDENSNQQVDVLSGAFMLTSGEILRKIGGFDEAFFMYGEDIDLSYRIKKAGYKNLYYGESTILHFKGGSTDKESLRYVKMFYRAMSIFVKKHYGGTEADLYNLLMQLAIVARACIAAGGRLFKRIRLPAVDTLIILVSFWLVGLANRNYVILQWNTSPKWPGVDCISFIVVFLTASYFCGLYKRIFQQSRLNISMLITALMMLGLTLLTRIIPVSAGVFLFSSVVAYIIITLGRSLLVKKGVLRSKENDNHGRTALIAADIFEYTSVLTILQSSGARHNILGRVSIEKEEGKTAIGHISDISSLLHIYPVKEIILCQGKLTFKEIIELVKKIPRHVKIGIFTAGIEGIIGAES